MTGNLSVAVTTESVDDVTRTASTSPSSPRGIEFYFQWAVVVVGLAGAAANALILYAMVASRQHTKHVLIFNQNVCDFFSSLFLVITYAVKLCNIYLVGSAGYWFCMLVVSEYLVWLPGLASKTNLFFITIERYLKAVFPVWSKNNLHRWMIYVAMALAWISSVVHITSLTFPTSEVIDGVCNAYVVFKSRTAQMAYGIFYFSSYYVIELSIFIFCYGHILIAILVLVLLVLFVLCFCPCPCCSCSYSSYFCSSSSCSCSRSCCFFSFSRSFSSFCSSSSCSCSFSFCFYSCCCCGCSCSSFLLFVLILVVVLLLFVLVVVLLVLVLFVLVVVLFEEEGEEEQKAKTRTRRTRKRRRTTTRTKRSRTTTRIKTFFLLLFFSFPLLPLSDSLLLLFTFLFFSSFSLLPLLPSFCSSLSFSLSSSSTSVACPVMECCRVTGISLG